MSTDKKDETEVDVGLFNRQIYAIGMSAMKRMLASTYVFVGCDATAAETAKNVILSGVKKLILCDDQKVSWDDLGCNCFANDKHIEEGTNRAQVLAKGISPLNSAVIVETETKLPTGAELEAMQPTAVVLSNIEGRASPEYLAEIEGLRAKGIKLLYVSTAGVFVKIFNDFGDAFTVMEPLGDEPIRYYVTSAEVNEPGKMSEAEEAARTTLNVTLQIDITDHDLAIYDGDQVTLTLPSTTSSASDKTSIDVSVKSRDTKETVTLSVPKEHAEQLRGYKGGAYVISRDVPKEMKFASYSHAHAIKKSGDLKEGEAGASFVPFQRANVEVPEVMNFCRMERQDECFQFFLVLRKFEQEHGRRPRPYNDEDLATMQKLYSTILCQNSDDHFVRFSYTAAAQLPAFASFVGGILAQEVLKAGSLKFVPIDQFWYFDMREMIPVKTSVTIEKEKTGEKEEDTRDKPVTKVESKPADAEKLSGDRYQSQIAFWGKKTFTSLSNSNIFVVGSGAIGCEYIKILALAGIGAGPKGKLVVTDNDIIERSNLSRQFLFRNEHVGHFKAAVAAEAAKKINKSLKMRVLTDKVMPATAHPVTGIFNHRFWSQLSAIATAVDNVAAREFLDDMAVSHRKPMVDSGTLGAMGHVETILPFLTARLKDTSSGGDAAKKIPFCTLHFFPTTIDHCIQYATDMFAAWFTGAPAEANKFLASKNFDEFHDSLEDGARLAVYGGLFASISEIPKNLEECASWVRCQFESSFVNSIKQVLHNYPADKEESDGKLYWSGARKLPKVISFDWENENHRDYISYGAALLAEMYGISPGPNCAAVVKDSANLDRIKKAALTCEISPFVPSKMTIDDKKGGSSEEKKEEEEKPEPKEEEGPTFDEKVAILGPKMRALFDNLKPSWKELASFPFEKDDDMNGHVEFITSVSNVRASCYDIPPEDAHHTKKVAGRIIPAMITTTAAVTGLAALQLYNALLIDAGSAPKSFGTYSGTNMETIPARNFSVGVAEMSATQMFECKIASENKVFTKTNDEDSKKKRFSTWERFELKVKEDVTLATVINAFEEKYPGLVVEQIVEAQSSVWIYSKKWDASEQKALEFPFGAWTEMQIPKKDAPAAEGDAPPAPRTSFDFVLKCSGKNEGDVVSEALPALRYEFNK